MTGCIKFNFLKNKTYDQLVKEMKRRGMNPGTWDIPEMAANILAYDAYHKGKSEAIQKMKQKKQEPIKTPARTAKNYIYRDLDGIYQLRLTSEQKRLVDYFLNTGILDGSIQEIESNGWKDI